MTENKRFKYSYSLEKVYDCDSFNGETTESYGTFECCDLLNELYDENKQLQSENKDMKRLINNISLQRDEFHRGARENANRVGKLKKENEQLKASLYAEKTNTAEVVNDYSKQFKRHSGQFSFMIDLADDLGVDVTTLEALDD